MKMISILNGIHILSTKILETVTMQHLNYLVQEAIKPNCVFIKTESADKLCFKSNQLNNVDILVMTGRW